MSNQGRTIDYYPTPTLLRFHNSDALVRLIMGPVGSGKSTGCCWELIKRAIQQKPVVQKGRAVRRTRFAVIRNTYRELKDTTVKTWLEWFGEDAMGAFNWSEMTHRINVLPGPGEALVECEVLFRALDRPKDVKKLLSLELSGAWINEAREVPKIILDALLDRVGRFPPMREGGPTWHGIICDTNPPDDDHWWYRMAEIEKPNDEEGLLDSWQFFRQPGGLLETPDGRFITNPDAENIKNLIGGHNYYLERVAGKSLDHIRIYYCGQYGFIVDGKPIWPEFIDNIHVSPTVIEPVRGIPFYIGMDFGLTPAATFAQRLANGRWQVFDELVTEDMGISRFCDLLGPKLRSEYAGLPIAGIHGDPSGDFRAETDEATVYQILAAKGIPAQPAPGNNDFNLRRESVATSLTRMIDGKPGCIISPKCIVLRKGMVGGYCYKRMQVAGQEKYRDKPDKNKYSHVCESLQYLFLGAGEGTSMITAGPVKSFAGFIPKRSNSKWFN